MAHASIVTLTLNPTIDKSAYVPNIMPDAKMRCERPKFEPGGGGINVSRAVKKLGGQSQAFYTQGGPTGMMLEQLLSQEDLDHEGLDITALTRENFTAFEESSGREYRFVMPGPHIDEAEWQAILDRFGALDPMPAFVVASGSIPPGVPLDFYARLAHVCAERGAKVVVDTSGEALDAAIGEPLTLIKPNIDELERLHGEEIETHEELVEVARGIIAQGVENVVVSLGAGGAMVVTADLVQQIRSPAVKIRSKIGAGDSMVAGMVLSLARDEDMLTAAQRGVAAGSAAVMTPGTELCRLEDAERLYDQIANGY